MKLAELEVGQKFKVGEKIYVKKTNSSSILFCICTCISEQPEPMKKGLMLDHGSFDHRLRKNLKIVCL